MKLERFFEKHREIFQLVYGVLLIVLIPFLLAYNSIFIIQSYNESIDISLRKQALSLGRTAILYIQDFEDKNEVQKKINELKEKNPEFLNINVSEKNGEDFEIVASTKEEEIGELNSNNFLHLSFLQEENNGLAGDSFNFINQEEQTQLVADRYWKVGMPIFKGDQKIGVFSLDVSSKILDDLTRENRNKSLYLLIAEIIAVVLFLLLAVRFWDYVILYRKAKEVDQMKDEFISIASHELRTPVTGIKGYSSMILDGSLGDVSKEARNAARMINNGSERLATLVEDLLNVSRIEQGRMGLKKEDLDIGPIIRELIEELGVQAEKKKLKLVFNPHESKLPLVSVDKDKLKQVLINIIGNSIKYTEKGSVTISTYTKDNKYLAISVKDTGIGMNEEERKRLFQKFYRVKNEKTEKITGTGLGLWISKQIVELMDGKISVDSIKGTGTEFSITFPIKNK